ncbi:hypothetical protein FHS82_000648 [Pseudochelatococcus lubricantis]|uniref:ETC complex I subunit n=1 Tax=Pseudochelatococcus lubricantis TaxID=1538102 RepID=A0ABX0UY69_9HYPH|nr:hypothetical protein [Pseudochelatococcus lubricantis]NIJ56835.1 hypothetical protein [Pseudochelatococcus lubricantis]
MHDDLLKPARLQYWSPGRHARPEHAIDFPTLEDAVAFAMTHHNANREIAWIRTESGTTLLPSRIATLWELRTNRAA